MIFPAAAMQHYADADKFNSGLSKFDGVVECMNASVWAKAK
jgi:hypothetical protein